MKTARKGMESVRMKPAVIQTVKVNPQPELKYEGIWRQELSNISEQQSNGSQKWTVEKSIHSENYKGNKVSRFIRNSDQRQR